MAVNKVVFGAVSIMDISDSTVTADKLAKGVTAYDKSGEKITGTMESSSAPTLQEKTVTPSTSAQSITADNGYDGLSKVTINAMPTATQATPSITVSSAGKITASATQSAGYVAEGTKSATKQLTTQDAKTVTPTTSNQTAVASGRYTTGAVTVKGDANLVAGNIKSGTSIFGVTGTYEGSSPNLQSKSVTYTSNGTNTITPDSGYDGLSSVNVTVNVSGGGGGTTIPGIVELFTTSGLHYYPEYAQTINITFSAWPNYFGVYCTDGNEQNIFIGPAVYFGDMANYVNIENQVIINDVNFNAGVVVMQIYEYVNYYFLSDVEMTINTQ